MEKQADYITEAFDLLHGEPAAIIEQPHSRMALRDGIDEEWTVAWVKLSTAFKPHIKELRGAPLAVWLYISLSIGRNGTAFPGITTIANDTGYSRQGVMDAIKALEQKGYLHVRRGEKRHNIYEPEFAAIGRTNEPSTSVNLVDSSEKSQVSPSDESSFFANESSGLDPNKRNKIKQNGDKSPMPIEWQIMGDAENIVMPDETHNRRVDFANLVGMYTTNQERAREIALAFQDARGIVLPESKVKGQRKAIKEMIEMGVLPEHVRTATRQLIEKGMTVTDLFSVTKTAIDLANKPQETIEYTRLL